jgi:hypothetical protein
MTSASNASLVPQIKEVYKKVLEASKGTLEWAIKCGDLLNLAKEGMQDKAWLSWLRDNFPEIPQTTANLYMRLAKHKDVFDKQRVANEAKDGLMSIRSASKLLPQTETTVVEVKRRSDRPSSDSERVNKRLRNSGSPEADTVVQRGTGPTRPFTNLHYSGQNDPRGKPSKTGER